MHRLAKTLFTGHYISSRVKDAFTPTIRIRTRLNANAKHRAWLFDVLDGLLVRQTLLLPVSRIDEAITNRRAAWFLKHDVHGLHLPALVAFALEEARRGIAGTYLFMAPHHELTAPYYSFSDQVAAMHAIQEMGHELGLHLDPYYLMHRFQQPLREVLQSILSAFEAEAIQLRIGNMHGNSRFKRPDRNAYGTAFDLFEEIGRQQDFPELNDVPRETADLIRENRVRLRDWGITHWVDMPVWSSKRGFVVTNFVSDNLLGKKNTVEVLVAKDPDYYKLADHQPPGSRSLSAVRELCAVDPTPTTGVCESGNLPPGSDELRRAVSYLSGRPTLLLVHPQLYC